MKNNLTITNSDTGSHNHQQKYLITETCDTEYSVSDKIVIVAVLAIRKQFAQYFL